MRWVRWAIVVAAALALAGASAPHLGSGGSGGGALPMPTLVHVGAIPSMAPATPPPLPSAGQASAAIKFGGPPDYVRATEPGVRPGAEDTSDRSPVPWVLFGAIIVAAGAAVHTWWRRRRVLG